MRLPRRRNGTNALLLVWTDVEEDRYYLPNPFEKDGTYERSYVVLLGQVFPPPHASFKTESFASAGKIKLCPVGVRAGARKIPVQEQNRRPS